MMAIRQTRWHYPWRIVIGIVLLCLGVSIGLMLTRSASPQKVVPSVWSPAHSPNITADAHSPRSLQSLPLRINA